MTAAKNKMPAEKQAGIQRNYENGEDGEENENEENDETKTYLFYQKHFLRFREIRSLY